MDKTLELPITVPLFSTYHSQGEGGAVLYNNKSLFNWYYNEAILLECNRKFISGFTKPEITVCKSNWFDNPYLEKKWFETKYTGKYTNEIIRAYLNDGYYILFGDVDDYYINGKSFYHKRHFPHDGMICGYDQTQKTFTIFAYNSNWIYTIFKTPQQCFTNGRVACAKNERFGTYYAIQPRGEQVVFDPEKIFNKIREYIDCSLEKYPVDGNGFVYGSAVHDYIAMYLDKLADGSIPYERMDWRIMRLIWEHKKVMYDRIKLTEGTFELPHISSEKYRKVVTESDNLRMIYASYHLKRKDCLLSVMKNLLMSIKTTEIEVLSDFLDRTEEYISS